MVGKASAPAGAPSNNDWPAQAADTIVRVVDAVRANTTGRLINVARYIVFGLLIAIVALAAVVLLIIGLVRGLDVLLPDAWFGDEHTWVAHLIIGCVFSGIGAILLRKASRARTRAQVRE